MTKRTMYITLRPNERIFVNGAVIRVDRKVTIELLNDAVFLLEAHIMQPENTNTPLKQLYFAAQIVLIDPKGAEQALVIFVELLGKLLKIMSDTVIVEKLTECAGLAEQNRFFEVLKIIRGLFEREEKILKKQKLEKIENNQSLLEELSQ